MTGCSLRVHRDLRSKLQYRLQNWAGNVLEDHQPQRMYRSDWYVWGMTIISVERSAERARARYVDLRKKTGLNSMTAGRR